MDAKNLIKSFVATFAALTIFSTCSIFKKKNADIMGNVVIEKTTGNKTTGIKGVILELSTGEKLPLGYVWINTDDKHACDSNSSFMVELSPGTYQVQGRAFGYQGYTCKIKIKKGELVNLTFYLTPAVDHGKLPPFH